MTSPLYFDRYYKRFTRLHKIHKENRENPDTYQVSKTTVLQRALARQSPKPALPDLKNHLPSSSKAVTSRY